MHSQKLKADRFRALHERERAFFIPNPWDAGSARLLASLGFEALATTSSGFAYTLGRQDGQVSLEEKLNHCKALVSATDLPISADLENGFSDAPEDVARTILLAAETGIVGGSVEDYSKDPDKPIYEYSHAVERVQAAVEACRSLDFHFTLTARAENLLHGRRDLDDTIRRLQAFESAGADVVYAPGLKTIDEIKRVTSSVSVPVNVLGPMAPGITLDEFADAGARRVSIGGAMTQATIAKAIEAGKSLLTSGIYDWQANMPERD